MKVFDGYAGLGGWSAPFRDRGHEVCSVDIDARFSVDIHADMLELTPADLPWRPDVMLGSPPCEALSVLTMGTNWSYVHGVWPHAQPLTDKARMAVRLVERFLWLVGECSPAYWMMENPRAKLRKLTVVGGLERRTVTYCQYGARVQKPTDLWGGFPPSLELRPVCKPGASCHVSAPRGSRTGTQGPESSAERAKVPYELALDVCLAAETDLAAGRSSSDYQPQLWESER